MSYEIKIVDKKTGNFIIKTQKEVVLIDANVRGAILMPGVATLDIFYKEGHYSLSLHFESADEAKLVFEKIVKFLCASGE